MEKQVSWVPLVLRELGVKKAFKVKQGLKGKQVLKVKWVRLVYRAQLELQV
jgi:hypothetical protein